MKKVIFLLSTIMMVVLAGCSADQEDLLELSETPIVVNQYIIGDELIEKIIEEEIIEEEIIEESFIEEIDVKGIDIVTIEESFNKI